MTHVQGKAVAAEVNGRVGHLVVMCMDAEAKARQVALLFDPSRLDEMRGWIEKEVVVECERDVVGTVWDAMSVPPPLPKGEQVAVGIGMDDDDDNGERFSFDTPAVAKVTPADEPKGGAS